MMFGVGCHKKKEEDPYGHRDTRVSLCLVDLMISTQRSALFSRRIRDKTKWRREYLNARMGV